MMILVGCLLAALASGCAAFQQTSPAPSSIAAAFQRDDFTMARNVTFQDAFAAMATANNATTLSTGNPKRTYYVSGATPFNMGYALAAVGYDDLEILATTFLDHIVPSLLDKKLDQELQNGSWAFAYDILLEAFAGWLVNETTISFNEVYAAEAVPTYFLDEMKGLVAGAAAVNPFTQVTLDRLIALNFGIDWISSRLYSGTLLSSLQSWATTQPAVVRAFVESLTHKDLKPPVYCDAFAASGAATAGGDQSIFARDFQLATGLVLQDIESMIIWNTLDGRIPLVGVGAVGFVGSMTAMNNKGFAMGVDTLRSSFVNATFPGINSLFLVRATAHASSTSEEATEYIAAARRGVTWLYPMSDMQGDGRIIESGRYEDSNVVPDLSTLVEDEGLRDDLPPYSFLQQHSPVDYRHGVCVRHMNYTMPSEVLDYNGPLFERAGLPVPTAGQYGAEGFIFNDFNLENENWFALGSRYFSPSRMPYQDMILCSNMALTPQVRIAQFTEWASIVPGEAMQWRYDMLNKLLQENYGKIDLEVAKYIITFLSPDRTPGYWNMLLNPNDPMSAEVEGCVSAMDLKARVIASKTGYWADNWFQLTLPNYV